ncbi:MAG: hypothetical protein IPL63_08750 [Saprospiraceae bacterium]|nr:hypothetical protein [Saprospiraceae bacterium]MBK6564175.1 hypothetical protein [Saprospiraceae bacterium]MBK6782336.1 hypothetical protein [Saprospiraceae bacterium]MBK7524147.1 hypothetical protein [Saprospiraceae bacterium]MBK8372197.1 hypothetical protein [Saprospiraceae bacterium]
MKNLLSILLFLIPSVFWAQTPTVAIISFDANQQELQSHEILELLRMEVSKHGKFQPVDRYEIDEVLSANEMDPTKCFSQSCLFSAGKLLNVDFVFTGSADKLGDAMFLKIRMLSVKNEKIEKEIVMEFLYIPQKINTMVTILVNELFNVPNDEAIVNSLSNKESYESAINNPQYQRLNLSGPRMGYTFFTGETANILKAAKSNGGYDALPAMFQIGYQFEAQYLNEGKWQALVEFIPLISGFDQGLFIPSVAILNGIRSNVNGIEFAIGPSFNIVKKAEMIFSVDQNKWVIAEGNVGNQDVTTRLDSRGKPRFTSYVVLAGGYSIRSGKLNIPINAYFIPSKDDFRFGISFGFNIKRN